MTLLRDINLKTESGLSPTATGELKLTANVEEFTARQITAAGARDVSETVARELPVTVVLNNQELVTLLCSPADLKYLAVGFLASEDLVHGRDEIRLVTVDDKRGVVRVVTHTREEVDPELIFRRVISSGCGRGASFYSASDASSLKVDSAMQISADEIFSLVNEFQHSSPLYPATHGNHSAALCDRQGILVFSEDIGRHNAIDKIFGKCLLEDIPTADRAIITSGRVTSEVLHKVAKRRIPLLISISAPTNLGVRLADTLGITLVASVRGRKMNVYTHGQRVLS
jgi:FdhD protein